ncbi:hypothetical protein [uncultured Paludibaculum sp.]|nr:hypothetical protein [uncultured Paludibaculum sp.]
MNSDRGKDGLSPEDLQQYAASQHLQDVDESAALAVFDEPTQVLVGIMPG